MLAPAGLQRRLSNQALGRYAELRAGVLRVRREHLNETDLLCVGRCRSGGRAVASGHWRTPRGARSARSARACGGSRCTARAVGSGRACQLLDQQVCEPQALALRHLQCELLIVHLLIEITLFSVAEAVAELRRAHGLEHHVGEQALELARGLADRLRIITCLDILPERTEGAEVGVEACRVDAAG